MEKPLFCRENRFNRSLILALVLQGNTIIESTNYLLLQKLLWHYSSVFCAAWIDVWCINYESNRRPIAGAQTDFIFKATTYQQLMKSFHKFYRSHSDELKKFGTTLMELRSSIWKEVLVEYILLNYIWTYFWCVRGCVFIFFHCFMCYLLRARFPIFCSRVPVSLWCIFSWRWAHTLY